MPAKYDTIGVGYAGTRRRDPRIAAAIDAALGDARSVVNVGAGTGSYEPVSRSVLAIEPSEVMIAQRPDQAAPCIQGFAEALPLADASFDVAMAVLTIHHWSDWRRGLKELKRVARRRVVILTFDVDRTQFWLTRDYFPEIIEGDRESMPPLEEMCAVLGTTHVAKVDVPHDCTDGFLGAYWKRPEAYLDPIVRRAISGFSNIDAEPALGRLADDLASGRWRARNADLLTLDAFDIGYRLVRADV